MFSVEVLLNAYMQTEEHSSFGGISPTAGVMEEERRAHASGASFSKKKKKCFFKQKSLKQTNSIWKQVRPAQRKKGLNLFPSRKWILIATHSRCVRGTNLKHVGLTLQPYVSYNQRARGCEPWTVVRSSATGLQRWLLCWWLGPVLLY